MQISEDDINPDHLEAIIMASLGYDVQVIADKCRVSYRTIQNWRSRPDFQRLVKQCTVKIFDRAISNISLGAESAAKELQSIIENSDTPVRLKLQAIGLMFSIGKNFKKNLVEDEPTLMALNLLVQSNLLDLNQVRGILESIKESQRVLDENIAEVFNK